MSRKQASKWTVADLPSQNGRVIVVTGTSGLGFETASALVRAGAEVILVGRNPNKGEAAVQKIRSSLPAAAVHFEALDLADLASVRTSARRIRETYPKIDVLINNAGVIMHPERQMTKDGFELQFGTNYLGHFALTAHLMPLLQKGNAPRVVNVCALAANRGIINFDDLQSEQSYKAMSVYGQSKLANLMFALELHRRSEAGSWGVMSLAAHPGLSRSDLVDNGSQENSRAPLLFRLLGSILTSTAEQGILPTLFAATSQEAASGHYYGPDGAFETKGYPAPAKIPPNATDLNTASRLWELSKQLTQTDFDSIPPIESIR